MPHLVKVARILTNHHEYSRRVAGGLNAYSRVVGRWMFRVIRIESDWFRALRQSNADGVVAQIASVRQRADVRRYGRPAVNVSAVLAHPGLPTVCVDNEAVGALVADHFMERGFRHFGFIGNMPYYTTLRKRGYVRRLAREGYRCASIRTPDTWVLVEGGPSYRQRQERVREWLRRLPKPAGVFGSSDSQAAAIVELCRESGLVVPDEIAVVGVDNSELDTDMCWPPLSSVDTAGDRVGYEAGKLLARLLKGRSPPSRPILLPPAGIVVRGSSDVTAVKDKAVAAAVRFIRENIEEDILVTDVARHIHLNRRTLEIRFRRLMGRTVRTEIRRVRLQRAQELLRDTSLTMPEVAERSGYPNAPYLSTTFHAATGMTPGAFRRQFQNA